MAAEEDPVLKDIDTTYEMIELTQDEILSASGDHEFASHDQIVAIEEYHTLRKAKTIIREILDPREEEEEDQSWPTSPQSPSQSL